MLISFLFALLCTLIFSVIRHKKIRMENEQTFLSLNIRQKNEQISNLENFIKKTKSIQCFTLDESEEIEIQKDIAHLEKKLAEIITVYNSLKPKYDEKRFLEQKNIRKKRQSSHSSSSSYGSSSYSSSSSSSSSDNSSWSGGGGGFSGGGASGSW